MPIMYYPLSFQTDPVNTIQLNTVTCCNESPLVKLYVPSRLTTSNYYDITVHKIVIPSLIAFPINGANALNLGDVIAVASNVDVGSIVPTHTCTLIHYTDSITVDIYTGIAGGAWSLVQSGIAGTVTGATEERILPSCLVTPGQIALELTIDCRSSGDVLEGTILRTGPTTLRMPSVVNSGTVYGTIDVPVSIVDLDTIDRYFVTDVMAEDMFPMSPTGRYLTIVQVMISSLPYAILMYGNNQTLQSQAIPLTDLAAVVYGVSTESAFITPVPSPTVLSALGGISEVGQYDMFTHWLYPSRATPYIEIEFLIDSISTTVDPYSYLAISLHHDTGITHVGHPGCPSSQDSVTVVLGLSTSYLDVVTAEDVALNTCLGGCGFDNDSVEGTWTLRIIRDGIGSILYIFQNGILLDSVVIPMTYHQLTKPLAVTWYLNGSGEPCSLEVKNAVSINPVTFPTTVNMCAGSTTSTTITPCMETADILAIVQDTTNVNFELETVRALLTGDTLTSVPPSDIDWAIYNSTQLSQVTASGLITGSTRCLYLPSRASIVASTTSVLPVTSMSIRLFVRLTTNAASDVIRIQYRPTSTTEPLRSVVVKANGINGWYLNDTNQPQDLSLNEQINLGYLNTSAVQANVTYCLTLVVSSSEMTLYVNGVRYSRSNISTFNPLFTPLTPQAEPIGNTLKVVVGTTDACYVDDIVLGWDSQWSSLTATALNNSPETRPSTLDCDWSNLVTDISAKPIVPPDVPSNYGGTVKSTKVVSHYILADSTVQVFSIPTQYAFSLIDVVLTSSSAGTVKVMYGNKVTETLVTEAVNGGGGIIRGIRLSRGMTLTLSTDVAVSVRISALLG